MRKTNGAMVVMCLPPCDSNTAPRTMRPTNEESLSFCSPFLCHDLFFFFLGVLPSIDLDEALNSLPSQTFPWHFAHYLRMHILYELGKERGEHIHGVFFFPTTFLVYFPYHFTHREREGSLFTKDGKRVLLHFLGPVIFSSHLHILWSSKSERDFVVMKRKAKAWR